MRPSGGPGGPGGSGGPAGSLARRGVTVLLVSMLVAASVVLTGRVEPADASASPRTAVAELGSDPVGAVPDLRRFRLGAIGGERLRPNRADLAARGVSNGPLLLFLPATRAAPADYTQFLGAATNAGYHVLGLDYWNLGRTLSGTCGLEPHCYTQVQRNRFDGTLASENSEVQPAGSIVSRLRGAIAHLTETDPAGGWGRFVDGDGDGDGDGDRAHGRGDGDGGAGGRVRWGRIVVAGHSQGGSEAAYIGHIRPVRGVLMFGAPAISAGRTHAAWLDRPGRTPASRMYALGHVDDEFGPFIGPSWAALTLDGTHGPVTTRSAMPIGDPHAVLTTVTPPHGVSAHAVVVSDLTPRDPVGNPVLLPVWRWMLTRFPLPLVHPEAAGTPSP